MKKYDVATLINMAVKVSENAYCPYSNFKVGAALLTANGNIYTGVNCENSSYPSGICAERAAISAAISAGERRFIAIAIVGGDSPITPCGICRQVISEFGDIDIICSSLNGENYEITNISDLLPSAFKL